MRLHLLGLCAAGLLAISPASPRAADGGTAADESTLRLRLAEACTNCEGREPPPPRPGAVEAIVTLSVNLEPKGEFVVLVVPDGDVLVSLADFRTLGLAGLKETCIEDSNYLSLKSLAGLKYVLDQATLELKIQVDVRNLANRQVIDLAPKCSGQAIRPPAEGVFINYNVTASGDDRSGLGNLTLATEIGAHVGEFLFLTDGVANYDRTGGRNKVTRLSTSLVRDRPETLERLVLGDFVTAPGTLGSALRLGGVSLSRRYGLDPYLVRFPGQIVSGSAALPSEVFLYSNGVLIRRDRVAPGSFQLQNLVNLNGLQVTEVVIRDVLGNEQRITNPFYFSDALLRRGLDEYSFDAGLERRQFGTESNDYGRLGAAAFYRRGLTDSLTLGARGEALGGRVNFGPTANFRLGTLGVVGAAFDYGRGDSASGSALSLSHVFQTPHFGSSVSMKAEERTHPQAASTFVAPSRLQLAGIVSLPVAVGSSVSMSYSRQDPWDGQSSRTSAVSYRQSISRQLSYSVIARHTTGLQAGNEVLLSMSFTFDRQPTRPTLTAQVQSVPGGNSQTLQVSGGTSDGEGISYRASFDGGSTDGVRREALNSLVQYNFRQFTGRAEYFHDNLTGAGSYQVAVSGAVARVGGQWGASRLINDSFGMVKVGDLAGIRVYANNIEIGRTGDKGTVFVPRLASYFENPIAIEDKDLPMNVTVPETRYLVLPTFRSGTLVDFAARRIQAVAGRLVLPGAKPLPLGNAEGTVMVAGRPAPLYTSRSGEFYLEDVGPGVHEGRAVHEGGECRFTLRIPENEETVFDVGAVVCNAAR